jgi:hypothetical protein
MPTQARPSLPPPGLGATIPNFHAETARAAYAPKFRAIGIPAVAAGAYAMRHRPKTPRPSDIPAILRGDAGADSD